MTGRMTVLALAALLWQPAFADPDRDESGHGRARGGPPPWAQAGAPRGGEWVQEYREGNCKIERKWERSGEFKQEVKCDGPPVWAQGFVPRGGDWKQEYRDGNCKIERKFDGGEYKEEIACDGEPPWMQGYAAVPTVQTQPWANPAPAQPPLPPGPSYGDPFLDAQGRYCREYQTTGYIDGREETLYGYVCLRPDGNWAFND